MYFPEFSITTSILKNIGSIEASRAIIDHIPLLPPWEKSLQREASLRSIYHSSHFDGNPLSFEELKAFLDGRVQTEPHRSHKEIENLKKAHSLALLDLPVNEETLKSFHKLLLKGIAPENKTGVYRSTPHFLKNTSLTAPAPDEILAQLRSFFAWFESPDAKDLPTPIRNAILYFEIFRISPFETENKKVATLITELNSFSEKFDHRKFVSVESHFDESPSAFFSVIRSTQNNEGDITRWIEYFLHGLAKEFESLKTKVIGLTKDNKVRKVAGMEPLNDRQERIIEYLNDYQTMQNREFLKLFPHISEDTILRDLKDLIKKGLVVKSGSTKSSMYKIKPSAKS